MGLALAVGAHALKIAMVTEYAYPLLGGVPEHVHFLSRELAGLGHEVTVITGKLHRDTRAHDAAIQIEGGYRVERIGRLIPVYVNGSLARVSVGLRVKPKVARAIADADVVHAQGLAAPMLPLWALRTSRAPVTVGTFHTYFTPTGHRMYQLFFSYIRATLARVDRRIAVSDACVEAIAPIFPGTFEVIPNGVDCELFRPLRDDEARPAGPPRILFMGRFDPRNGLDVLLDAAGVLANAGYDFAIDVVGDGPTRRIYERQARKLGLWDRITWHGLIREGRDRLYREATVFASPCHLASFGVVLIEALASGAPIVCADNVGFRQVIRDGMPAAFVPPKDPEALAAAIASLLDDPERRAEWSTRGRDLCVERYSWPSVAVRIDALYEDVLATKSQTAARPA
jgi:phosphatidyl-myo-inositol alpha-mannosyltransferase